MSGYALPNSMHVCEQSFSLRRVCYAGLVYVHTLLHVLQVSNFFRQYIPAGVPSDATFKYHLSRGLTPNVVTTNTFAKAYKVDLHEGIVRCSLAVTICVMLRLLVRSQGIASRTSRSPRSHSYLVRFVYYRHLCSSARNYL